MGLEKGGDTFNGCCDTVHFFFIYEIKIRYDIHSFTYHVLHIILFCVLYKLYSPLSCYYINISDITYHLENVPLSYGIRGHSVGLQDDSWLSHKKCFEGSLGCQM